MCAQLSVLRKAIVLYCVVLTHNNVFYYTQEIDSCFLSLSIQDKNSVLLNILELKTDYCLMKRKLSPKAG